MDTRPPVPPTSTTPIKNRPGVENGFIETLNARYGLDIRVPGLHLSPQKRKEGLKTETAKRAHAIHSLVQFLQYKKPEALEIVREQFQDAAKTLCSRWVPKPGAVPELLPATNALPRASNPTEREELELCLLALLEKIKPNASQPLFQPRPEKVARSDVSSTLFTVPVTSRPFRKRLSDEAERGRDLKPGEDGPSVSKRAKSALDLVPVRGKVGQPAINRAFDRPLAKEHRSPPADSNGVPTLIDLVSANTSYTSVMTDIFSSTSRIEDDTVVSNSQLTQSFDDQERQEPKPDIISPATAFYIPNYKSRERVSGFITSDIHRAPSVISEPERTDERTPQPANVSSSLLEGQKEPNRTTVIAQNVARQTSIAEIFGQDVRKHSPLLTIPPQRNDMFMTTQALHPSASEVVPREHSGRSQEYPAVVPSWGSSLDVDSESGEPVLGRYAALNLRLQNSWPKLPQGLTRAPLPIIWEVTRAALHCEVELGELTMSYDESWHDQAVFDQALRSHPAFRLKSLPGMCSPRVWKSALSTFRDDSRAVTMVMQAKYNDKPSGPFFLFSLEPLKLELGHRLGRRFGSDRFLDVVFPSLSPAERTTAFKDPGEVDHVRRWISQQQHVVLGRIWYGFFLKDAKIQIKDDEFRWVRSTYIQRHRVYFFCVNGGNFESTTSDNPVPPNEQAMTPAVRTKMELSHLMEWAIGLSHSKADKSLKLFSRLSLSLSPCTATVVLRKEEIIHKGDDLKSPTGVVMNDGIGRMSRALARRVTEIMGLDAIPSGFQGRIGSAKGFWIIDADSYYNSDGKLWIETYPSQRKWSCSFEDEAHRTFEVKNYSRELRSASLNKQFITVLEAQSIDPKLTRRTLATLLCRTVKEELDSRILEARDPLALQRWAGLGQLARSDRIHHGKVPFVGGLPNSDDEALKFLLDGGFLPTELGYIREMVYVIARKKHEKLQSKLQIQVPRSTYAYMVVDFLGVLEENEVHLGFSSSFQSDAGEAETILHDIPILVARAPAHFPSDIQKVKAVFRTELRHLKDVIVFSSKGNVPLADLLSGGDYDGDKAWICWDPTIVDNFQNAPVPSQPDLEELGYLNIDRGTFEETLARFDNQMNLAISHFIYQSFAFSMQGDLLGQCTNYKERLCYKNNTIGDDAAVLLSTLVSKLVDRAKQGITFTLEDWEKLKINCIPGAHRPLAVPAYMTDCDPQPRNGVYHILDWLKFVVIKPTITQELKSFNERLGNPQHYDPDLAYYFQQLETLAEDSRTYKILRKSLNRDLHYVADLWKDAFGGNFPQDYAEEVEKVYQAFLDIKPDPLTLRQPVKQWLFGTDWETPDGLSTWGKLKASCLFKQYYKKPKFVFKIAGAHLQAIKAERRIAKEPGRASRPPIAVIPDMYVVHRPDNKLIQALTARNGMGGCAESLADVLDEHYFDDEGNEIDDF
ncbi:hypothetical protein jhhlp_002107 [Lomentospora prolificans]|uniref:RNA-dependent RNA polymerase n=1 Tax=Lomentospora prolificans TaxID=41688 RepID=A0A2N3ND16_9PEZI|nr:hypothetical protein jhhlp_002107 [Lomentospora prolificans]